MNTAALFFSFPRFNLISLPQIFLLFNFTFKAWKNKIHFIHGEVRKKTHFGQK